MSATPLAPGESRPLTIEARPRNNRTGLQIEAGAVYDFEASGKWRDASIECGPDGHDVEKLRKFRFLRRSRPHNWFALMGRVGGDTFLIGSRATYTARESGELICYANDAWITYGNNEGSVKLLVTRRS